MVKIKISEKLNEVITQRINVLGYELVDLTVQKFSGSVSLRFLVDRPCGGISLKECQLLNQEIALILDREDIVGAGYYTLEVSSPGLDRPLITKKDFFRVVGRRLKVFLRKPFKKRLEIEGRLDCLKGESLFLGLGGKIEEITLDKIHKAKQVIE